LEYWKLYFPIAYSELVNKNAKGYKLDPFLIVGLMRQESSFNPDSLSRSGAIGLMQLMPKTGKNEFKKRYKSAFSEKDWHEEILYIPRVNISLGSQHMAHLLKKAKGDPVIALAGYNAGLSRALKWKKTIITPDPDLFIEMIPFRETKAYVKKVMRNYFNYITLYGDGEEKHKVLALNTKDL
jgi:soluble lytic murein transglycosylase